MKVSEDDVLALKSLVDQLAEPKDQKTYDEIVEVILEILRPDIMLDKKNWLTIVPFLRLLRRKNFALTIEV